MRACFVLFAICISLTACQIAPKEESVSSEKNSSLISGVYKAVDELVAGQKKYPKAQAGRNVKVLVATVANLNALDSSSAFGLIVSEQVSSRLAQLGISVAEVKMTGKLFVSKIEGELVLSREALEIGSRQKADLILVGSYVEAGENVYVNLKLVRAEDAEISSAYNFVVSKGPDLSFLLEKKQQH